MSTSRLQQGTSATATAAAVNTPPGGHGSQSRSGASRRKAAGYGLPCAKCHLYYPADLESCPTCHHKEREATVAPRILPKMSQTGADPVPDHALLEAEREEFLRQFKSQLMEAHANVMTASETVCRMEENHPGAAAPAEICGECHERVQERLDACEAALQIDVKEAAQIVYDAVWADSSDPSKTYQNAATALLTELRKRAGVSAGMGPFEPLEQ